MSEARFFPFNPRAARALLALGAIGCLATGYWSASSWGSGGLAEARVGISAGLFLAFAYVRYRLHPREGWGVLLSPAALVVARPLSGDPAVLPWSSLRAVTRAGKRRETLVLLLEEDRRLLVPRHLFASNQVFDELASTLEERAPAPRHDA